MAAPADDVPCAGGGAGGGGERQPHVACSAPYRVHVLERDPATGEVPACDCGRQHMVLGQRYKYCTCGLSKTQPFCDDLGHVGTPFKPLPFVCDRRQTFYLLCGW